MLTLVVPAKRHGFKTMITNQLGRLTPAPIKRLILPSTLCAGIVGDRRCFDAVTLTKLNSIMQLARRDDALLFPIQFFGLIWADEIKGIRFELLNGSSVKEQRILDQLLAMIPDWLVYCTPASMREDLAKLIRAQSLIFA